MEIVSNMNSRHRIRLVIFLASFAKIKRKKREEIVEKKKMKK